MFVLLFFSLIALALTYFSEMGKVNKGLKWGMILVTFIAAIHYNYGSDYEGYFANYRAIIGFDYSLQDVLFDDLSGKSENGWVFLQWLMKPFGDSGFYVLVALISIFQGVVVYKLIEKYVPEGWRFFALFVYLFDTALYVGSMSGMRQHLAMAIVGCSLPLILNRKFIIPAILVLAASTIHKSALVFLPFIFWGYLPHNNTRRISIIYIILYFAAWIVRFAYSSTIDSWLNQVMTIEEFETYEIYLENEASQTFGLGFVLFQIPIFVSLYSLYRNAGKSEQKKTISLCSAAFVVQPIVFTVPMAFRVLYYFWFFNMLSYPLAYSTLKNKSVRYFLMVLFFASSFYSYIGYFHLSYRYNTTYIYHSLFDLL